MLWLMWLWLGADPQFQVGAAAVDITPTEFPVIVNGYFLERTADRAHDRLKSRAVVLDDGRVRLAIVVVDSLMLPRSLLDEVKEEASRRTGIPTDRMLISATHTHSAPSAMACLGSREDPKYVAFLKPRIVQSIVEANERLRPAEMGWAVVEARRYNHCRRWIFRPDRIGRDPFGRLTVRANMHPGHQSPNHIGPSGPADRDLTLIGFRDLEGNWIAVLANFAFHYYGTTPVSGDVAGRFGPALAKRLGTAEPPFVGMLSQGTSGDSMWMDYSQPAPRRDMQAYTEALADLAAQACRSMTFRRDVTLAMAETTLKLARRVPDEERLAWAEKIASQIKNRLPRSVPEVYALEQFHLQKNPTAELKLQAIRIGSLGIVAIPNEVYGITGLKIKLRSPLKPTCVIELANGAEGYIPPPEQHYLGGYTTWEARTAGLEVQAEPKIVETVLELLEQVSGGKRRPFVDPLHQYANAVLQLRPTYFWRLGEIEGTRVTDAVDRLHGRYEPGVAFYLPGPQGPGLEGGPRGNRAAHFAGGRAVIPIGQVPEAYSVAFWVWNGFPIAERAITGYVISIGRPGDPEANGDHVGIGGTASDVAPGRVFFFNGNRAYEVVVGRRILPRRQWAHVVVVRAGRRVRIYVNGQLDAEGEVAVTQPSAGLHLYIGGRSDGFAGLEGRVDEVAFFDRALTADEVARLYKASGHEAKELAVHPESPPLDPDDALRSIHVRPGYRVELVAAEPLVQDPVAIAWGPDGKLWVAEMADYPLGIDGRGKPGGRIRFLEDTDGDGAYDRSTVFLDKVPFPTGVMPWRNGVLVTAAPEILYAEDTNGDGRADVVRTLFRGFHEGNQQLRVNGLRWGLDNWVHCANGRHRAGYRGQDVIDCLVSGQRVNLGSRDFRFQPDKGILDPQSGPAQFGRIRDDWGDWFGTMNSFPLWHYVLRDHYLRRNPHFIPPDPRNQLFLPMNPPVYPAKEPQRRYHHFHQAGRFTSACGPAIYRDELLFPRGDLSAGDGKLSQATYHAFVCEPFHNLVQHRVLYEEGVTFRAERDAQEGSIDFFASRDRWCRPVMVRTGPDGALWVVDMYRYVIEHPEFLPPEGKAELQPFYRAGSDRGRIYRILPEGVKPRPVPRLSGASNEQLVDLLAHPNGVVRDLAHQVLLWRNDAAVVPRLRQVARSHESPLARLHALSVLAGLKALDDDTLRQALRDPHPRVRRLAVRWAEGRPLLEDVARLWDDPDPKVRLQVAFSLGEWADPEAGQALARLALRDGKDRWMSAAILSSLNDHTIEPVLRTLVRSRGAPEALTRQVFGTAIRMGRLDAVRQQLTHWLDVPAPTRYGRAAFVLDVAAEVRWTAWQEPALRAVLNEAGTVVARDDVDLQARVAAVRLLARRPEATEDIERLVALLSPREPLELQRAAVERLGELADANIPNHLLSAWPNLGLALRSEVVRVLSRRPQWLATFVHALRSGRVRVGEVDASSRQILLQAARGRLREELQRLFQASTGSREEIVQRYRAALSLEGNAQRGWEVFKRVCSPCHRVRGVGAEVGPNLAALTDRRPEALLRAILDPNASVDGRYMAFTVLLDDGRILNGMIASETSNSVELVEQEGKRHRILRSRIEELRSTGTSYMPEGLEEQLSLQDLADLIEFLRGL